MYYIEYKILMYYIEYKIRTQYKGLTLPDTGAGEWVGQRKDGSLLNALSPYWTSEVTHTHTLHHCRSPDAHSHTAHDSHSRLMTHNSIISLLSSYRV